MLDLLDHALEAFSSFLWSWPLIILLLGTHLYLTVRLRFPQRYLFKALGLYFSKSEKKHSHGDISQFSSLMIALAASIGTGNIIGVATAVTTGGPGAVFWCWLTGFLGMATRYGEGLLAVKYRVKTKKGEMAGGPMYALERGLNMKWLAVLFAVFTAIAAFGIGNVTQGNSAALYVAEAWDIPRWGTGLFLTALTAMVMLGGIKSIGKACAMLVPLMAVLYMAGCLIVLVMLHQHIWPSICTIMDHAFSAKAAAGGFIGSTIILAMQKGVARGLFSNEAGLGSAPIAAAAAKTDNPARQALVSSTGPFWDTVVVCALTGIVIVSSIHAYPDISSSDAQKVTFLAFGKIPYVGESILTICLFTFVLSTILGWSYFGEKALEYLGGRKAILPYRLLWVVLVFAGCIVKVDIVWNFADCANALMAVPNLLSLIFLSNVIIIQTRYYLWGNRLDEKDDTPIPVLER